MGILAALNIPNATPNVIDKKKKRSGALDD